jgi:dihydrofolate reductase
MNIKMITAHDLDYNIGIDNKLPWHLPEDLKHFKDYTTNKIIIMGTNTFKSIGKALPNRRNVVISRSLNHSSDMNTKNVEFFFSIESMIDMLKDEEDIIVIGGSSIYKQFLNITNELVVTEVLDHFKGDTVFPEYKKIFNVDKERTIPNLESKNGTKYNINYYVKNKIFN